MNSACETESRQPIECKCMKSYKREEFKDSIAFLYASNELVGIEEGNLSNSCVKKVEDITESNLYRRQVLL